MRTLHSPLQRSYLKVPEKVCRETFSGTLSLLKALIYSQTCVKQPHKGSTKSGCLRQVAA